MGGGVGKFTCMYTETCSKKSSRSQKIFPAKAITKVEKMPEFKTKFCISQENIYSLYTFIRLIGEGYFSKVKLAYKNIEGESKKYAVKIIYKKRLDQTLRHEFLNELSILCTIDHPNVVKFYETYEDEHNFYLVMEYLGGGDIFQRIKRNFVMAFGSEADAELEGFEADKDNNKLINEPGERNFNAGNDLNLNLKCGEKGFGNYLNCNRNRNLIEKDLGNKDKEKEKDKILVKSKVNDNKDTNTINKNPNNNNNIKGILNKPKNLLGSNKKIDTKNNPKDKAMIKENKTTEGFIARISYKIISAINYCHNIGVVHRDIKPENILFADLSDDSEIKIIDFGLSKKFNSPHADFMKSFIGTPHFVAPEVIKEKYDSNCDMWSIGATLYMLFSGEPPFLSHSKQEILYRIQHEEPAFTSEVWKKFSCEAKDFLKKLLLKNPQKRLCSGQALLHKFFHSINKTIHNKEFLDAEILHNLKNFENPKKFKKLILSSLVNSLTKDELLQYNRVFNAIDLDHEGFISSAELKKAFEKLGIYLKDQEVLEIVKKIDYDKNGKVNYSEFLMAAINMKKAINEQRLYKLFLNFDTYNLGYIDKQSLKTALSRGGKEIQNLQEIMSVIEEVAKDGNNKISFEDFYRIMNSNNSGCNSNDASNQ